MRSKLDLGNGHVRPDLNPAIKPVTKAFLRNHISPPHKLKRSSRLPSRYQLEAVHLEHCHDRLLDIVARQEFDLLREAGLSTPASTGATARKENCPEKKSRRKRVAHE